MSRRHFGQVFFDKDIPMPPPSEMVDALKKEMQLALDREHPLEGLTAKLVDNSLERYVLSGGKHALRGEFHVMQPGQS